MYLLRVWLARLPNAISPDVILWFAFSKLGIYQKAFEHLGNTLTYDPTNYKVLLAVKTPAPSHTGGPTAPWGDLALECISNIQESTYCQCSAAYLLKEHICHNGPVT